MGAQPKPHIEIGMQGSENGMPVLYVRDNGIGIAPQYHSQIFGLFNRLDQKVDGTGIGLTLVKRIIEFHGGRILGLRAQRGTARPFFSHCRAVKIPNKSGRITKIYLTNVKD